MKTLLVAFFVAILTASAWGDPGGSPGQSGYYGYGPYGYYTSPASYAYGTNYLTVALMYQAQQCGYYDVSGDIHVNVRPGCSLKNPIKTTKDFQQATYQQTVGNKAETFTIATTKKDGVMTSVSFGEGESLEKAQSFMTYQYENGQPLRTILTSHKNGKTEKLAIWDASACQQIANLNQMSFDKIKECATVFDRVEKAIADVQAGLAKNDIKLAYQDFHEPGKYQAITAGAAKVADIFGLMKDCELSKTGGYVQNVQPNPSGTGVVVTPVKTTN